MKLYDLIAELSPALRLYRIDCSVSCQCGECEEEVDVTFNGGLTVPSNLEVEIWEQMERAGWCPELGYCQHCKAEHEAEAAEYEAEERRLTA